MEILSKPEFKKLDKTDLDILVEWANKEGWNPGPFDADVYWQTDPEGFYGYFLNKELIAGGSIVSYGGNFGFMGFFIVKPEYRNRGIGRKLWYQRRDTLISRLKPGAGIGMDGVVGMQEFYRKGGFEIAFRDERHERTGEAFKISPHIREIREIDYANILKYDKQCFGFDRKQFLIPWINQPEGSSFCYYQNNTLYGFAFLRKANKGYKIGPLFAENKETAEELYKACLSNAVGDIVYLDIPVVNNNAKHLIRKYNGKYVFECARMYFGKAPEVNMNKVFGITTFELG